MMIFIIAGLCLVLLFCLYDTLVIHGLEKKYKKAFAGAGVKVEENSDRSKLRPSQREYTVGKIVKVKEKDLEKFFELFDARVTKSGELKFDRYLREYVDAPDGFHVHMEWGKNMMDPVIYCNKGMKYEEMNEFLGWRIWFY